MTRILIVEDHPLFRRGLVAELSKFDDIEVVGEIANGSEVIAAVRGLDPNIVLLDIALPDKSGLDVLKDIDIGFPNVKVLMLSAFPEKQYAVRCLRNGAKGYLTKNSAPTELLKAIRKLAQGGTYVSLSMAEMLAAGLGSTTGGMSHESLSDREFQILCLIGEGLSVAQIAERLSLSVSSVHTYRSRVLTKLHLESTAQLVKYVIDNGLVLTGN